MGWTASIATCTKVAYLPISLAFDDCPRGQMRCGGLNPIRNCIEPAWLCDRFNDCGNNWDEQLDCGQFMLIAFCHFRPLVIGLMLIQFSETLSRGGGR